METSEGPVFREFYGRMQLFLAKRKNNSEIRITYNAE